MHSLATARHEAWSVSAGASGRRTASRRLLATGTSVSTWGLPSPWREPRGMIRAAASGDGAEGDVDRPSPSSIPDALPVVSLDADWRAYRARLAAMESGKGADGAAEGFREGSWAHSVPVPETGCILLAHPNMFGSNQAYFRLAAILILECSDGGALGVILNRPTTHRVGDVQLTGDQAVDAFARNSLWMGGDVGESAIIVVTTWGAAEGATEISQGLWVCTIASAVAAVESGRAKPEDFRFFARYAGWGAGQLQRECKAGVWFVAAASSQLALNEELATGPDLWHEILSKMGGQYAELSQLVKDSSSGKLERQPGEEP